MTRHDPTHYSTGRHGCWVTCTCGWRSATWTTIVGAELNFGRHLTTNPPPHPNTPDDLPAERDDEELADA
jgi:hypothetical protein